MRRVVLLGIAVLGVVCACVVLLAKPELARACGGFFNPAKAKDQRKPALAYEQTLIIFDSQKRREHFVREVVFRTSRQRFGFVVPTPTRPEVARVAASPFPRLRALFRFENLDIGTGSGQGFGAGMPRGKVKVLEVKKVGSFTAFILSADDATALADWLKKNQLVSSPEADVWLAHYVKMKFFYVAMRYDPPAKEEAVGRTTSETMRISFDSELAYYPYFEPDPPGGRAPEDPRMLDVWYVADSRSVPVATRSEGKKLTWVRPFQEGIFYPKARPNLTIALGDDAKLLPEGELVLQRFIDQKRSRVGFGDVVFVPAEASKKPNDSRSLIGVLDPALAEGAKR
jgi:hypothetical protein